MLRRHATPADLGAYQRCFSLRVTGALNGQLTNNNTPVQEALIQASPNNANNVGLGAGVSGNAPIELVPGGWITVPVAALTQLRAFIQAGDYVNIIAFTN